MLTKVINRQKAVLKSLYILALKSHEAKLNDYLNFQSIIDIFAQKKRAISYYKKIEHAAKAIENKTRFEVNIQDLSQMPLRSLGYNFYKHICQLGAGYEEFPNLKINTDYDYINTHMFESHDLWHTVLGFDTSVRGEIYLQAFMAAQTPGYLSNFMCFFHLTGVLFFRPNQFLNRFRDLYQFYRQGKKAKHLFGVDWNQFMIKDLNLVRAELGISI